MASRLSRIINSAMNAMVPAGGTRSIYGGGGQSINSTSFGADDQGGSWIFGWQPFLRTPDQDTRAAWVSVASRVIDTLHNSGWLAGAVDQARVNMVGAGLALNSKPDPRLFGGDAQGRKLASEWSRDVERRYADYCNNPWACDLAGRMTMAQIESQAVLQYFATGEIVATLPYKKKPGNEHGVKVNLMPSVRLSQTVWGPDANRGRQGVILDADGAPESYCFEDFDSAPNSPGQTIVRARDRAGNPVVVHLFDNGPGALRGISPLAPSLKVVRQFDQVMDSALTTMLIHNIFSATVTSDEPTVDIMKALQDDQEGEEQNPDLEQQMQAGDFDRFMGTRFKWYQRSKFDLGRFGKVVHMFPGEKLDLNRSDNPSKTFEPMMKGLQREICRCLGITYNQGTGDYVGETYNTTRMSSADIWLVNVFRRSWGPARLKHENFKRWLEEDIAIGRTEIPGGIENYRANKAGFEMAEYRGPPKPTADDLKTAKANQIIQTMGWATGTAISADYGNDQMDNLDQLQAEQEAREDRKLPPLPALGGGNGGLGGAPGQPGGNGTGNEPPPTEVLHGLVNAIEKGDTFASKQMAAELREYLEDVE